MEGRMERVVESGRENGEGCREWEGQWRGLLRVGGRMERILNSGRENGEGCREWEGKWRGL